eukprot:CAMPEP_0197512356 /NCGR_PEP_ID=MMETSP1312-20131121/72478_1 /TAXON_ID=464262 /ORGANISM="Genus nov. species nov., Strain RCC2335" /LENGTH=357 /DNA_ID=CAMNT_0043060449 /DNA_START=20 /DNA_END=1092 /DNA_ORIENTATION=-
MLSQPELVTFGGGPGSLDPAAAYLDGASMHESCAVAGEGEESGPRAFGCTEQNQNIITAEIVEKEKKTIFVPSPALEHGRQEPAEVLAVCRSAQDSVPQAAPVGVPPLQGRRDGLRHSLAPFFDLPRRLPHCAKLLLAPRVPVQGVVDLAAAIDIAAKVAQHPRSFRRALFVHRPVQLHQRDLAHHVLSDKLVEGQKQIRVGILLNIEKGRPLARHGGRILLLQDLRSRLTRPLPNGIVSRAPAPRLDDATDPQFIELAVQEHRGQRRAAHSALSNEQTLYFASFLGPGGDALSCVLVERWWTSTVTRATASTSPTGGPPREPAARNRDARRLDSEPPFHSRPFLPVGALAALISCG